MDAIQYELYEQTPEQRARHWAENTEQGRHVLNRLIRIALGFKWEGKRVGHKAILENLRREVCVATGEQYAINNSYTATLARLAMEKCPELQGYFKTHQLREAGNQKQRRAVVIPIRSARTDTA